MPKRPPAPRPLADPDETVIDDTVADRTLIVDTDRTEVDSDRTEVDSVDRTEVDGDRTEVDSVGDRTEVDRPRVDRNKKAPRRPASDTVTVDPRRIPPPRPIPRPAAEEETVLSPQQPRDNALPGVEELSRLGGAVMELAAEAGRWLMRWVVRPTIRGAETGARWVTALLRGRRPEDSDAYSRRRGQQWRRFREGDPSINELREFDKKFRDREPRDRER